MISLNSIKDPFFQWADLNSSFGNTRIQWAFQNIPIPSGPEGFLTMRIMSLRQVGDIDFKEAESPVNPGDVDGVITLEGVLELQAFQIDAFQKLQDLKQSINIPSVREILKNDGIAVWNIDTSISDISGLDNSENEERAFYEQPFRICDTTSNIDLGIIEIVNMIGNLQQDSLPDIIRNISIDAS